MGDPKRVLIVGGSGFVGTNLARDLSPNYSVVCTHRQNVTRLPGVEYYPFGDISDRDACKNFLQRIDPGIVIYTVGSNDIALAEGKPRETQYQHTTGATQMQAAAESVKAKFIYLSSGTVFSGHTGNHTEDDTTIPNTNLGKAKLATENHIRGRSLNYLIIRSAHLLGRGTLDHPSWVDYFREQNLLEKKVTLSKNIYRNPVHISYLSELMHKCIERDLKNQILHLGGLTKISEYGLAERLLPRLGLKPEYLEAIETSQYADSVDYSLNTSATLQLLKSDAIRLDDCLNLLTKIPG